MSSVPLLIALCALPAYPAPVQLDETWNRWMRPRSDSADQLAARVRQSAHRGAVVLVEDARTSATRQQVFKLASSAAAVLVACLLLRALLASRRRREELRLSAVRNAARRTDQGGR